LLGTSALFQPAWRSGFERFIGDLGDSRFILYLLEHTFRWVQGGLQSERLWNPAYFYPAKNLYAYSETFLGIAPLYWLPRLFGLAPDVSYQVFLFFLFSLNYLTFYRFARRWLSVGERPAALGAFLFAYAGSRITQLAHAQLMIGFVSVLIADSALTFLKTGRRGWLLPLLVAWQFYVSFYFALFSVLALGVGLIVVFFTPELRICLSVLKFRLGSLALGGVMATLMLFPWAHRTYAVMQSIGYASPQSMLDMTPSFLAWINTGPSSVFYRFTYEWFGKVLPMENENRLGLGFLTTAIIGIGFAQSRRNRAIRALIIGLAVLMLLSFRFPGDFTLWRLIAWIPGVSAVRAISRIGVFLLFGFAIGFSLFFERGFGRHPKGVAAIALICALEQLTYTPTFFWRENRREIGRIAAQVDPKCPAFFYNPASRRAPDFDWRYQIDAMWVNLMTGVPTLNGYTSRPPAGWDLHVIGDFPAIDLRVQRWLSVERAGLTAPDYRRICWVK